MLMLLEELANIDTGSMTDETLNAYLEELRQEPENDYDYEPEQGFSMTMM